VGRDEATEARLLELWRAGSRDELVTRILRAYGPEILSYLLATLRAEGEASEGFSVFTMSLWEASASFRGESSFRTWAYALARHAVGRLRRQRGRQRREVALSAVPEISALAAKIRSETLPGARTEARDRIARLRAELDTDEQTLLILRVDRGFAWPDVARVLGDGEAESEDALARRVVALRKRFERIKERLKRRALELR
jgi:RNA polymerase sigma-70 factor, ECF subfamily